jgi:general secretion pathway protein D
MSRPALALGLCLLAAGCASSQAFKAGQKAERRRDYDVAMLEYSRALKLNPDNQEYRQRLDSARMRAAQEHAFAARRLAGRGLFKEAIDEFRLALDLNPKDAGVAEELRAAEKRVLEAGTTPSVDEIKEQARERSLPGLELGPEAREPLGLSFRNASLQECYQALGRTVSVNFVFDPQFVDERITVDLRDLPFEQALAALGNLGKTFHRVTESHVITVVPDTPTKRREYEQQVVKTFFLSNADLKDTIDLLRVVLGARRVAPVPGANALTINDTPEKVSAAERILQVVDKRRAEVVVEVEILEVNRSKLDEYGIQITSPNVNQGLSGVAGAIFPKDTTLDQNPYAKENIVVTALPGVIYRLLKTDTSTRLLANPQLRTSEGQTAQARFGDQVPVPVTTFSPIAAGGVNQQAITSFEYKNVGVNIDITPRVHHDGEVTLALKIDISAVGPAGFQGLPTFNSRTVTSTIRLKDGETNILAGLISDNERRSLDGIPGLSSLPVLGRIFSHNKNEGQETDIVMTLTPHVLQRPAFTADELRSFQLGSAEASPLLFDVPSLPSSTPLKPLAPPRIEPIRPPSPTPSPAPEPQEEP